MLSLSITCSADHGGIAIADDSGILYHKSWSRQKSHGQLIAPSIYEAFQTLQIPLSNLNIIAVDNGPGSFTGIRVAINTAKTLAYSINIPVLTMSSLELMAQAIPLQKIPLCVLLNAHSNKLYFAQFIAGKKRWKMTKEPQAVTAEDLKRFITKKHLCIGTGYMDHEKYFSSSLKKRLLRDKFYSDTPCASTLAQLALDAQKLNKTFEWNLIFPLYIRDSGAEEKLREVH